MEFNQNISDIGFPYCPICGTPLGWESSYTASEAGYLPEDTAMQDDIIIESLICRGCDHDFEATQDKQNHYRLFTVCKLTKELDEEPKIEYGDYAIAILSKNQ